MRAPRAALACTWGALFLAAAPTAVAATPPTVSTGGASAVTSTSATVMGTVNPEGQATTYDFQFGTTTAYGSQTAPTSAGSGTTATNVSAALSSLPPNATIHYRLVATNASGTTMGTDHTFKTPATPMAPAVTTGGTSAVTSTSATLKGTVNPEGQATTYHFQYGPTTAYGSQTTPTSAGSGTANVSVSVPIGSLPPNTTIHYRLTATNASGTSLGHDRSFKTSKQPSARLTIGASPNPVTFGHSTTISGKVTSPKAAHTTVTLQDSASPAGPFVTVRTTTTNSAGHYSFSPVAPQANTYFRTLAPGATSGTLRVRVRFRITLFVSNTHPARGALVRFHGRVAPRHNGLRARIQRLTSGGFWHTIARARLTSASGNASAYSVRVHIHRGGLYRAVVGPDAHHARGFSRDVRIRVH